MALPAIFVEVGAKIDGFEKAMGSVSKQLNAIDGQAQRAFSGFDKIGARLTDLGGVLTAGVTLPMAAAGVAVTSFAKDFDLEMRKVTSLLGSSTNEEFQKLSKNVLDVSRAMGIDATKAASALYEAISAGVPKENAVEFLAVASKAAIAGVTDTKVAVDGLTSIINSYGLEFGQAKEVSDAMFQSVNLGKFSFEQLASSISVATPLAAQLGIGFKDLLAAAATLTSQGYSVSEAMTSLRSAMVGIITPNKDMNVLLAQTGFTSGQALIGAKGLHGALGALQTAAGGNVEVLTKAIGRVEGLGAVLGLTGDKAGVAGKHLESLRSSTGAAGAAFEEIEKSSARAFERVTAELKVTAIEMGTALLPAVNSLLQGARPLVDALAAAAKWFGELSPAAQTTGIVLAGLVAAAGPVVLILGQMATAVGVLGPALTSVGGALATVFGPAAFTAISAAVGTASVAIKTFALSTLPAVTTALSAMASTMLTQAAASFTTFATVSIPAAIAALVRFATVSIPAAITGLTTLSATAIPSAVSGFTAMATGGIASAGAALMSFATTAVATASSALSTLALTILPVLGVAATAAAAAFAGWAIGRIAYDQIPGVKALGDAMGDLILKVPGVAKAIEYLTGASRIQAQASSDLGFATDKLERALAAKGITVAKTGKSTEEYGAALREAAKSAGLFGDANSAQRAQIDAVKKSISESQKAATLHDKALAELGKTTRSTGKHTETFAEAVEKEMKAILAAEKNTKAHEEALKRLGRESETAKKSAAENEQAYDRWREAGVRLKQSTLDLAIDYGKSHEKMRAESLKTVEIVVPLTKRIPEAVQDAIKKNEELADAYRRLGVTTTDELKKLAAQHLKSYELIRDSGKATAAELEAAFGSWADAAIKAAKSAGEEIPAEIQTLMGSANTATSKGLSDQQKRWENFGTSVSTVITNFAQDISKSLWDGDISWGEKGKNLLKSLGEATTSLFIEPATKAIEGFISGVIKDLLAGKGLGGVLSQAKEIGKELTGIFSAGSGAASTVGGASSSGSGVGGAAASAAGAASSGVLGIVNAISGVATAVSSIVGNFQMAGMNKSLDLIEHETRFSQIHLKELVERAQNLFLAELPAIRSLEMQYLNDHAWRIHDVWERLGTLIDVVRNETNPILSRTEASKNSGITLVFNGPTNRETIDYAMAEVTRNLR